MRAQRPDEPPGSGLPEGSFWDWGEIYVWGGVTYTPGRASSTSASAAGDENVFEQELAEARSRESAALAGAAPRVWAIVREQYPVAARKAYFSKLPLTPPLATQRFSNFVGVLDIGVEEALQLVRIDSTPLLVDPDGVAIAFDMLVRISSREKALELVRRHPGLLVGGEQNLKKGETAVTTALVDVLYAGRLRRVLEDTTRENALKVAEIEFYAQAAAFFKPVMDLMQRRPTYLQLLFAFVGVVFLAMKVVAIVSHVEFDIDGKITSTLAWMLGLGTWVIGLASWGINIGPWALGICSWFLHQGAWLLGSGSWISTTGPWAAIVPSIGAWALWFGACILGWGSWILALLSWILGLFMSEQ